jgi:hypothetical protein
MKIKTTVDGGLCNNHLAFCDVGTGRCIVLLASGTAEQIDALEIDQAHTNKLSIILKNSPERPLILLSCRFE